MIKEIYIRTEDDPNFQTGVLEHSNEVEMILGKLRMIFNTRAGSILGDANFGLNLEDELFSFDINDDELKTKIRAQVDAYIDEAKKFDVKFDVKRFRGTVRDIILIDVIIDARKYMGFLIK